MINVTIKSKSKHNTRKGLLNGSEDGVEAVLSALQTKAKKFSPYDKGTLRSGVQKEHKGLKGRIYDAIRYALFQEKGTKKMIAANQGKGFFKPAADAIRNQIDNIMGAAVRKGLRRN